MKLLNYLMMGAMCVSLVACGPKTTKVEDDTAEQAVEHAVAAVEPAIDSAAIRAAEEAEKKANFEEQERIARLIYTKCVLAEGNIRSSVINDNCTQKFRNALRAANEYDDGGYAVWVLRTGAQDGDGPSKVTAITPVDDNTVLVKYKDMGISGSTRLIFVKEGDQWKVDGATTSSGKKIL